MVADTTPEISEELSNRHDFSVIQLGDDRRMALHSIRDNHDALLRLFSLGKREARLFSRDLDVRVLNQADIVDALSALARRHRLSKIQILIVDPDTPLKTGHRLVDLSQRLSSRIEARIVHPEFTHLPFNFITVDDRGYYYRSNAAEYHAEINFNGTLEVKEKNKLFDDIWQQSQVVSQWRRLHI